MGVVVRITAYLPTGVNPTTAFRAAFDRVAALEQAFSTYRHDSEARAVEARAWKEPVKVSNDFSILLGQALRLARDTDGAFDPTVGRITRLARRHGLPKSASERRKFARAGQKTGWRNVAVNAQDGTVSLRMQGMQFDFGGIAKGYAADQVLRELAEYGITRALVAIAGDIAVGDPPPDALGWEIGLDAVDVRGVNEHSLILRNRGVSTSGSRERSYALEHKRCSHIVAPEPGGCTDSRLAVSVVAPTATEADGLATGLVALGPERAGVALAKHPDIDVYWAYATAISTSSAPLKSEAH